MEIKAKDKVLFTLPEARWIINCPNLRAEIRTRTEKARRKLLQPGIAIDLGGLPELGYPRVTGPDSVRHMLAYLAMLRSEIRFKDRTGNDRNVVEIAVSAEDIEGIYHWAKVDQGLTSIDLHSDQLGSAHDLDMSIKVNAIKQGLETIRVTTGITHAINQHRGTN